MSPVIHEIGPVRLTAQLGTSPEYHRQVSLAFAEYVQTAERFVGDFSVADDNSVRDWSIAGAYGAQGSTYLSTFHVDADATREDVIAIVRRLAQP